MRIFFVFSVKTLIIVLIYLFLGSINAQDGAWLSQGLHPSMDGEYMGVAGGSCAAYTQKNAQYIYFFDMNCGKWTELDLNSPQNFHDLIAEGPTIMAFTDSLLIGYSASKSEWDTLCYSGELLQSNYSSPFLGYGYGESLAYFVTDSYFYVFDPVLAKWMFCPYTLPGAYKGYNAKFWAYDDYAAAVIPDYEEDDNHIHLNMAYSLHTQSFSSHELGGSVSTSFMGPPALITNHGYISNRIEEGRHLILGYSALSNTYYPMWIDPRPRGLQGGSNYYEENFDSITASAYYYNEYLSPEEEKVHMYGFDTRYAAWNLNEFSFNPQIEQAGFGNVWIYGGQVAVAARRIIDNASPDYLKYTYIVYNGQTGQFQEYSPGLRYSDAGYAYPIPGGTVVMAHDDSSIWFHSIETGQSLVQSLRWVERVDDFYSENFAVLISSEIDQDSADVFIYNGNAGSVIKKTIFKSPKTDEIYGNSKMCVIYAGANAERVILYSGITHEISELNFSPAEIAPSVWFDQGLAFISTSDYSVFYDSFCNANFEGNYKMKSLGMGHRAAMMKKDDNTINTYSSLTRNWMEYNIPDNFYVVATEDVIGLFRSPSNSYFYAFNGYNDQIIKLQPHGTHRLYAVGGNTILVCRSDSLYAFHPQVTTYLEEDNKETVSESFNLKQNYPNPFNTKTMIHYSLPVSCVVKLSVFNILGQKVVTLVSEKQPSGSYTVEWDASGKSGIASGVYLYKLSTNRGFTQTRKLVLLK